MYSRCVANLNNEMWKEIKHQVLSMQWLLGLHLMTRSALTSYILNRNLVLFKLFYWEYRQIVWFLSGFKDNNVRDNWFLVNFNTILQKKEMTFTIKRRGMFNLFSVCHFSKLNSNLYYWNTFLLYLANITV